MSSIVSTDLPHNPERRLAKQYQASDGTKGGDEDAAVGIVSPLTLNGSKPSVKDAMGITPSSGILHFVHNGAQQNFIIWYWNARWNKISAAEGWIKGGEGAAINTKQVDPNSNASFKCPPKVPYYLQAAVSAITECLVHDAGAHPSNPNTDPSDPV
jgi:hypothetical protein